MKGAGGPVETKKSAGRSEALEHLWSPWRMEYILSERKNGCIFCEALDQPDGTANLVVHRAGFNFVILNRFPYTTGHLMVVPYLHKSTLVDLKQEIRAEMLELATRSMQAINAAYQPQGFNVGINIGEAAGAGIQDHVHMHVVPRWGGDTNFMSALGEARVLPELLEDTYTRIMAAWDEISNTQK